MESLKREASPPKFATERLHANTSSAVVLFSSRHSLEKRCRSSQCRRPLASSVGRVSTLTRKSSSRTDPGTKNASSAVSGILLTGDKGYF